MTAFPLMEPIAQLSAVWIVDCLLEGVLIALFAAFLSRLSNKQSSATRFVVWFCALMAIAATPLASDLFAPRGGNLGSEIGRAVITLPGEWAVYVFGIWAVIAGWFLARIGVGLWRLHTLRKSFDRVDLDRLDRGVHDILQRGSERRCISLCTSKRVQVPAAIGLIDPLVVIPTWMLEELSSDELSQILLHELAHLRRRDDWTNLAQQVVKALFFFHPAVWWIEKKISLEREMACDDAVIAETARPRAYAECLQRMAEKTLVRRTLALAQAAFGRVRQTSMRVAQILDANRPREKAQLWKTAVPLTSFVFFCALVGAKEPELIAFQDGQSIATEVRVAPYGNVRATPASFVTREEPAAKVVAQGQSLHAAVGKNNAAHRSSPPPQVKNQQDTVFAPNLFFEPPVQVANSRVPPVIPIETVLLVVESRVTSTDGAPSYAIEVWHLTWLQPTMRSSGNAIPKKI
jgi:beta-lactamase regulating signal transducer with metallopeptidase domain